MFNPVMMTRKRRMKRLQLKEPLSTNKSMACHFFSLHHLPQQHQRQQELAFSRYAILSVTGIVICSLVCLSESVSVTPNSNTYHRNINVGHLPRSRLDHTFRDTREISFRGGNGNLPHGSTKINNNYHFLEQQNEYDSSSSGVSILDDDTLRLSLAIDDDTAGGGGLSAPSLHFLEPKVYLRVSGESGMIKQAYQQGQQRDNNEVIIRESSIKFPSFRTSSQRNQEKGEAGTDLHYESNEEDHEPVEGEDENDDMNDNYHHHFPYIESYREKYVKPDFGNHVVTTTPPSPTPQPTTKLSNKDASSLSSSKLKQQEWSDIIAQVTTPSSFNDINSSASEHKLADISIRANIPAYFYNKYSSYSEEDLENVADLDHDHSKYFVKTRPRSVTAAGNNIYSNFYYEPPSFSTKSVPIPVKTNKNRVFASVRPTTDPLQQGHTTTTVRTNEEDLSHHHNDDGGQIYHDNHDDERGQQYGPVMMTNMSTNFDRHVPNSETQQTNYDGETEEADANHNSNLSDHNDSNESVLQKSALTHHYSYSQHEENVYYKDIQNNSKGNRDNNHNKSSAETLDVSTSQSILSKVAVNNPRHPQLVIIKSEPIKNIPGRHELVTSGHAVQSISSNDAFKATEDDEDDHDDHDDQDDGEENYSTEPLSSTPSSVGSTTTDATSIPGVPGIDYPTLGDIPQTGFDCQKQRYKGFFADIDAKCQAWHYCDFTDGHSTFLCPNGTLFSQVLLTCDWWFNVDCNQARQLYVLNERLYRYIKPPKPSFPEDFIGEHVDKWLLQQFTNGYLPKVRKKSKAKLVHLPPTQLFPITSTESRGQKNDTEKDA